MFLEGIIAHSCNKPSTGLRQWNATTKIMACAINQVPLCNPVIYIHSLSRYILHQVLNYCKTIVKANFLVAKALLRIYCWFFFGCTTPPKVGTGEVVVYTESGMLLTWFREWACLNESSSITEPCQTGQWHFRVVSGVLLSIWLSSRCLVPSGSHSWQEPAEKQENTCGII